MNDKLKARRKKLLQYIADFISVMLEMTMDKEDHFNFWMWQGLSLDYWCVERDIWLD